MIERLLANAFGVRRFLPPTRHWSLVTRHWLRCSPRFPCHAGPARQRSCGGGSLAQRRVYFLPPTRLNSFLTVTRFLRNNLTRMPNLPLRLSMKRVAFALAVWLVLAGPSLLQAEDGVIDLGALPNYAKQARPSYIFGDNTPLGPAPFAVVNPITNTGATLGRLLFYDK